MNILVTGASGAIGRLLVEKLLAQGYDVCGLWRNQTKGTILTPVGSSVLAGDITQENLGIECDWQFDAVYHVAGSINLGKNATDLLYQTNVVGTKNVVEFCRKYKIKHLYYVSSAYAGLGHNYYETTKAMAEKIVLDSDIPLITIFKPSIVLSPNDGHFSRFIETLIMIHRRGEIVRRKIEGTLHLPVIEPVFRIKGNPDGCLDLVEVDSVVNFMSEMQDEGIYWLNNPDAPILKELGEMVGKAIMVNLKFEQSFNAMPLEMAFEKIAKPFIPYLQGEMFYLDKSFLPHWHINQDFIDNYIKKLIR